MIEKRGALPAQVIRKFIEQNVICGADVHNVQPASIDLTLSSEIYRVDGLFLPKNGERVRDAMQKVSPIPVLSESIFEVGLPYLARLNESLVLPADVYAYANPKSTTGRNDVKVSLIADGISRFDSAGHPGYSGELWVFIEAKSYRVKFPPNQALAQLRLFNKDTRLNEEELKDFYEEYSILFTGSGEAIPYDARSISDRDGGLILTVDLERETVGYVSHGSRSILDFSKRNFYDPLDFFDPIRRPTNDMLLLRKGSFYIFYTREYVRVPAAFACEVASVDTRNGEYRSHYAGFVDPGWGCGEKGDNKGRPLVLEVRPFDDNILLTNGQPVCKLIYERMSSLPDIVYGEAIGSTYHAQSGPRLSKQFKQ